MPTVSPATIGIDVGATKIRAGLVTADGLLGAYDTLRLTPDQNTSGLVEPLVALIASFRKRDPTVRSVGVGTAGIVTWPDGEVAFAANHGYRVKLRDRLREQCAGLDVVVDNDANVGALAQASRHRHGNVLFVAIGTGLGSGFLVDGEIFRGGGGGRGVELGHVMVEPRTGQRCACGATGCLETLASGSALAGLGREAVRSDPDGALAAFLHKRSVGVSMRSMISASQAGVPEVRVMVKNIGKHIGRTIGHYVLSLFPADRIVIGGGLSALGAPLTDPIQDSCARAIAGSRFLRAPRVSVAPQPADSVMIGAGLLAHRGAGESSA